MFFLYTVKAMSAAAYLSFRSFCSKIPPTQRWFVIQKMLHWGQHELTVKKHYNTPLAQALMAHLRIHPSLWNEFWWRQLRYYRDTNLFNIMVRNYL
jgi:hypothetical protein